MSLEKKGLYRGLRKKHGYAGSARRMLSSPDVVDIAPIFWPFVRSVAEREMSQGREFKDDSWMATCPLFLAMCEAVRLERPLSVLDHTGRSIRFDDLATLFSAPSAELLRPGDPEARRDLELCLRLIERSVLAADLAEDLRLGGSME